MMFQSTRWALERVLSAQAGTVTLLSALLAIAVWKWFLPLTAFVEHDGRSATAARQVVA